MKHRIPIREIFRKYWFLLGILIAILLAEINPELGSNEGFLNPEITVKYGAVSLIFFISGLSLRSNDLLEAISQYKLHAFIQIFALLLMPLLVKVLTFFLWRFCPNEWILKGLITVSCMPPPVSTAVILTRAVGGNEAAAIFNSALGSLLGILVTPLTLLLFLGTTTLVPLVATIFQLAMTVLLPLCVGQAVRSLIRFRTNRFPLGVVGQISLLFIIYTTFCQAFLSEDMDMNAVDVLTTVVLVFLLQIVVLLLVFTAASHRKAAFSSPDVVTILFCATHKSLTLGIPMLRILYGGYAHLSTISLPLLVYHPTQIMLGGLLVGNLKAWMRNRRPRWSLPA